MPKHTCKVCGRTFKTKGWLTRHLKKWPQSPKGDPQQMIDDLVHRITHGAITPNDLRKLAREFGVQ